MRRSLLLPLFLGALLSCSPYDLTGNGNPGGPGLRQRVTLSTNTFAVGDSISVRSVVVNVGRVPDTVSVSCVRGVRLEGLTFADRGGDFCAGIFGRVLAPGDSIVETMVSLPIASPPGDYTLTVRQLISPAGAVALRVRVIAATASH